MRIGLVYDVFDAYPWAEDDPPDADAEYEPEATVTALEDAVDALGFEPVRVGTAEQLWTRGSDVGFDAAINIAEGARSRNREGYAPTLLEMAGVPYVGSDALTLSLSLDKAWTKDLAMAARVATPSYRTYRSGAEVNLEDLPGAFPHFVKPRYEGASKGITANSVVRARDRLVEIVDRLTSTYQQDVIVEPFVDGGGEFTVAVIGHDPPEALPVLQRAVDRETRIGLHALEHRGMPEAKREYALDGAITPALEQRLHEMSLTIFEKLECRDFARVDYRVDDAGQPWFLEINPLPTFDPTGTFAIISEIMGRPYKAFLADVFARAFRRIGIL